MGHDVVFLMPVPSCFYSPVGIGCIAVTGSVVNADGGGGIGGCASVGAWAGLIRIVSRWMWCWWNSM